MKNRSPRGCKKVKRIFPGLGDNRGYLLPEIMIAIGIFSIGFLAVGSMVISGTSNNASGNLLTQATFLATETLERLKSLPIADLEADPNPVPDPNNPVDARGAPGGIYTRSWTIQDLAGSTTARRVEVTVSWTRFGNVRTITLSTITKGNGT